MTMPISTAEWKNKGQWTELKGHKIFHVDTAETSKPTLLLIHGFPTASWDWVKIWRPLQQSFRLVTMDMLGFGYSDKPDSHTYSIHEQADLVESLVSQLGLEQFHVLAHDYGDTVAQELLARQNERVGKGKWLSMCFLNGGLFPETHRAKFIQKLLLSPMGPLVNKLSSINTFRRSFSSVFGVNTLPTEEEIEGFWELINYNGGRRVFHKLITYINDRKEHRERWLEALQKSCVPIGLINGLSDPVSGAHMVQRFRKLVGKQHFVCELVEIGHYPQVEAPGQVIAGYLDFLKSLRIR